MALRPLPRSLVPLPLESLPGYLLRLAHRLDLSPSRVALLTGLASPRFAAVPASRMFCLEPGMIETFARITRLTTTEATSLTLISLAGSYPPLDPAFSGRHRVASGMFVKENWVFFRTSRYCPRCLAGDGSLIQQCHGGAWSLHWRLPVVFACTTHRQLLEHSCPVCHQPAHHRGPSLSQVLPLAAHSGLHPAQCRSLISHSGTHERVPVCGARLDQTTESGPRLDADTVDLLDFQDRLLGLLRPDVPAETTSVGQGTAAQRYFVDLRILSCLITASWPAARDLVDQPAQARLLDQHVRHTRSQIRAVRDSGRAVRELAIYDRPPVDAATCWAVLTLADRITATGDTSAVRKVLHPLVASAPAGMQLWARQFLAGDGYCSPGLQTALGLEIGNANVARRTGIWPRAVVPPPQSVHFGIRHIPQHLLPQWYAECLAELATEVKPRLLRRAAAARLAQICVGGSAADAAQLLAIPRPAAANALTVVHHQLSSRSRRAFDSAIDRLADHLNNASDLIDYGTRRDALTTWIIPLNEWGHLIAGLRESHVPRGSRWPGKPFIDWGDSKRILASMWIWVRITQGEHIFAPPIRPDVNRRRPSSYARGDIHSRWPFISAEQPHGHYAELREQLDAYADKLANDITVGKFTLQH